MKTECGIARDLMPLCIDGIATQGSVSYVEAHMETCEPCKDYYEMMRAQLHDKANDESITEKEEFEKAAKKVRKRQQWRGLRKTLVGVVLGVLLLFGGYEGYMQMAVNCHASFPMDEYDLNLSQLEDGRVVISTDFHDTSRKYEISAATSFDAVDAAQTLLGSGKKYNGTMFIDLTTSILPQYNDKKNGDIPLVILSTDDATAIDCIVRGHETSDEQPDGTQIVWQRGESIPPASKEMEEYYQYSNEIEKYTIEANSEYMNTTQIDGHLIRDFSDYSTGESDELDEMYAHLEEIRATVPEWQ